MNATSQELFDPSMQLPFDGYRHGLDSDHPLHDLIPSLRHFYESEKFRGTNEELRLQVLDGRTAKEAGKIAKRNKQYWRADWKHLRGHVFRAGLAMQVIQSRKAMALARNAFDMGMEIGAMKSIGGLPGSFVAAELQNFFGSTKGLGVAKLGLIALNGCVPDDIEERLDHLFKVGRPVSAAVYAGHSADRRVEAWCALRGIPVRLTNLNVRRLREEDAQELTARINTLVSCMPMSRKEPMAIIAAAAAKRPKIRVVDLALKR